MTTLPQTAPPVKAAIPVPLSVLYNRSLSDTAIVLYAIMLGGDIHTPNSLSLALGKSIHTTRAILAELIRSGLATKQSAITAEDTKQFLCTHKKPSSLDLPAGIPFFNCPWCTSQTVILHEHHWPVPRAEGGTKTVGICAGCHAEYHSLCCETFHAVILDGKGNPR